MTIIIPKLIGYPPAPTNGGPLEYAPDKIGDWAWQPKIDDRRVAIHAGSGTIYNQYGELSIADKQHEKFAPAMAELARLSSDWLDCGLMEYRHDMMRGSIIVFDIMANDCSFDWRRTVLEATFDTLPMASELLKDGTAHDRVYLVNQWSTHHGVSPVALQAELQRENAVVGRKFYEGLVAKRRDAGYPLCTRPKQSTHLWIKHRFDQ